MAFYNFAITTDIFAIGLVLIPTIGIALIPSSVDKLFRANIFNNLSMSEKAVFNEIKERGRPSKKTLIHIKNKNVRKTTKRILQVMF